MGQEYEKEHLIPHTPSGYYIQKRRGWGSRICPTGQGRGGKNTALSVAKEDDFFPLGEAYP